MMQRRITGCFALLFLLFFSTAHGQSVPEPDTVYVSGKGRMYVLRGTVIDGASGNPVAGAEIVWKTYRGSEKTLESDADGRFEYVLDETFGWRSILYARHGEKISQLVRLLREWPLAPVLVLGEPATFSGLVTGADGSPVAGATVRLLMEDVYHESTSFQDSITGADGRFALPGLPPGSFGLAFGHDAYYLQSESTTWDEETTTLDPGKETIRYFRALPRAHISGHVTGPNGESVSSYTFTLNDGNRFNRLPSSFKTDDVGHFDAYVNPREKERDIWIQHVTLGPGKIHVPPLESGAAVTVIDTQLLGTAHVSGRVLGPDGEPVVGAQVNFETKTAEGGRFELGHLPLGPEGKVKFSVAPPNKIAWWLGGRARGIFPTATDPTMLWGKRVEVSGAHGDDLEVDVVLESIPAQRKTHTRTVRGAVWNEAGQPAAGVQVVIYEGQAEASRWLEDMCPIVLEPPEPGPWRPRQSMVDMTPGAVLLARLCTDEDGSWEVQIPCGVVKKQDWLGTENVGLNHLTVAASDGVTRWTALARFDVDSERSDQVTADLELGPLDDDLVMQVTVVDEAGQPLAGVPWLVNTVNGPFVTGADGLLTILRLGARLTLTLQDTARDIADVQIGGSIIPRLRPASDPAVPPDAWTGPPGEFPFSMSGPGVETEPPYLKRGTRTVEFHFFDTREGSLTIVLGPNAA